MKTSSLFLFIIALFICNISNSQTNQKGFTIIPLGVKGGLDESNLSAYLVKANGAEQYICLDAGTIYAGLQKATLSNYFGPLHDATEIQKKFINSYFISHGHLDHTAGLVMNSPGDSFKKNIASESIADDDFRLFFEYAMALDITHKADRRFLKQGIAFLAEFRAFAGFGSDIQKPDASFTATNDGLIVNAPHHRKSNHMLGTRVNIGAAIDEKKNAPFGRDEHPETGPIDTWECA